MPTSSFSARQIAKALLEVTSRLGLPNVLVSDQAPAFTRELMEKLCELTGVQPCFSVAYHSQSRGVVERVKQTLFKMLKSYMVEFERWWSEALPYILYAYRTAHHDSLGGLSPAVLIYSWPLREPLKLLQAQ